jgi:aldehyde dehydrogenase (NAD+)
VFDPGHVTVVEGGSEESKAILNQQFDFIFYTGSERVGTIVAKAAAEHLTPTVLELGGKCPCVVREDSDLDIAANRIAAAKFFNAGQTCFSPDFVIAHQSIRAKLAQKITACVTEFYSDNPTGDLASIVNDKNYERLSELMAGSENITVIGTDDREHLHMAPRILPEASWDDAVMQDEIFGPILPILEYKTEAGLIEKLGELSSPLALYVFTRDLDAANHIADSVRSGAICINDLMKQSSNLNLPFGGVGKSGMGRYRGKFGFDAFTYQRAVTRRYFVKDVFATHPPYAGQLEKLRKMLK